MSVSQRTLGLFQAEVFAVSSRVVMSQSPSLEAHCRGEKCLGKLLPVKKQLPSSGCILQHATEQSLELARVRAAEAAQEAVLNRHRNLPQARIHRAPLLGHLEIHEPAVLRAARPADEPLALEAIDHPRHGASVI